MVPVIAHVADVVELLYPLSHQLTQLDRAAVCGLLVALELRFPLVGKSESLTTYRKQVQVAVLLAHADLDDVV